MRLWLRGARLPPNCDFGIRLLTHDHAAFRSRGKVRPVHIAAEKMPGKVGATRPQACRPRARSISSVKKFSLGPLAAPVLASPCLLRRFPHGAANREPITWRASSETRKVDAALRRM